MRWMYLPRSSRGVAAQAGNAAFAAATAFSTSSARPFGDRAHDLFGRRVDDFERAAHPSTAPTRRRYRSCPEPALTTPCLACRTTLSVRPASVRAVAGRTCCPASLNCVSNAAAERLQRVARTAFIVHARAYVVVNAFLIAVWALAGAGYFWPAWVILGWGLAVVLQAMATFARSVQRLTLTDGAARGRRHLPLHRHRGLDAPHPDARRRVARPAHDALRAARRTAAPPRRQPGRHPRRRRVRRVRSAADALAGAIEAQAAVSNFPWPEPPLRVRMGLHTGEAVVRNGDYVGLAVHEAARICSAGHGGQVLCSASTLHYAGGAPGGTTLVDLGRHRLKDLPSPTHLWQLGRDDLRVAVPRRARRRGARQPAEADHVVHRPHGRAHRRRRAHSQRREARHAHRHRRLRQDAAGAAGRVRRRRRFPHGAWLVELAGIADPDRRRRRRRRTSLDVREHNTADERSLAAALAGRAACCWCSTTASTCSSAGSGARRPSC